MAKFKYRMQNVLDVKKKLEDAAKMEFGQASARLQEEERKLENLEDRKRTYEAEGRRLRKQKLNVMDLRTNTNAISALKDMIALQEEEVENAKEFLELKRMQLQHAMQERKTQDKLYENAFQEFMQEENARESKEVDELVSYVYGQRAKEQGET